MKVYNWDTFTCCSGTYIQNMAEYYNLAYYHDADGLYVNLYLPSDVTWRAGGRQQSSSNRRRSTPRPRRRC